MNKEEYNFTSVIPTRLIRGAFSLSNGIIRLSRYIFARRYIRWRSMPSRNMDKIDSRILERRKSRLGLLRRVSIKIEYRI